jgi:hypothetical protein
MREKQPRAAISFTFWRGIRFPSTSMIRAHVMIFKIFSPKNFAKKVAFFAQTTASFCINLIITLVFEKNANILAKNGENCRKL